MAIIIEGPDLAGKTTFAKRLARKLKFDYEYGSALHRGDKNYTYSMRVCRRKHCVVDRWWPSEKVYHKFFGRPDFLETHHLWMLGLEAAHFPTLVVFLDIDKHALRYRYQRRGDAEVPFNDLWHIAKVYHRFPWRRYLPMRVRHLQALDDMREHLEQVARAYRFLLEQQRPQKLGWGRPEEAPYLFVGDIVGSKYQGQRLRIERPFITSNRASCGAYLFRALDKTALRPHQVRLVNSLNSRGTQLTLHDLEKIRPRGIVALGQNAARRLESLNCPFGKIDHPQYMRRFWSECEGWYAEEIQKCLST